MWKTKAQTSCAVTAQLISAFVFATQIVQSLYFLNPKFSSNSHLQWLYSLVCVGCGPGRKPPKTGFLTTRLISQKNKRTLSCHWENKLNKQYRNNKQSNLNHWIRRQYEPRHEKTGFFAYAKTKAQTSSHNWSALLFSLHSFNHQRLTFYKHVHSFWGMLKPSHFFAP